MFRNNSFEEYLPMAASELERGEDSIFNPSTPTPLHKLKLNQSTQIARGNY